MPPEIVLAPADILSTPTATVEDFDDPALDKLIDDLRSVASEVGVAGIAANQIGSNLRVCIVKQVPAEGLTVMVNPKVVWRSKDELMGQEGCLSLPGVHAVVKRSSKIVVQWTTPRGMSASRAFTGLRARVTEHEIDHLDGVLMTDRGFALPPVADGGTQVTIEAPPE